MPEFTIGDSVIYTPSFGTPKQTIVMSAPDSSGYMDIQFVDLGDFQEFSYMGISKVISESDHIGRVPESALSFEDQRVINVSSDPITNNNEPQNIVEGRQRRRRPSTRSRRRGPRRHLSH